MADQAPKLNIGLFDGSGDAESWLRRFKLISTKLKWTTAAAGAEADTYEAKTQMGLNLAGVAGRWYDNLQADQIDTYDHLCETFKRRWVTSDSRMVVEQQLSNLRLTDDGDVETYFAELTRLGARLERKDESLAVNFLNGLSEDMKNYCLNTDTHTLDTYKARAKLHRAMKKVDTPSAVEENFDDTNAFGAEGYNRNHRRGQRGNFRGRRGQQNWRGGHNDWRDEYNSRASQQDWSQQNWRGGRRRGGPRVNRGTGRGRGARQNQNNSQQQQRQTSSKQQNQQQQQQQQHQKRCFGCGSSDHLKNKCPYGDPSIPACGSCSSKSHVTNQCPF